MKKLTFFVCAALILVANSCKKDSTSTPKSCGTFSCTIDGTSFPSTGTGESTLIHSSTAGTPVKRMDIRAKAADGKYVILTITNLEGAGTGEGINVKTYYADPTMNYSNAAGYEGALVTYSQGTTSTISMSDFSSSGTIKITSCDAVAHEVSGNFNMPCNNMSTGATETFSGSFSGVCYTYK